MMTKRLFPASLLALGTVLAAGACESRGLAYGDPNSIIAVVPIEQWDAVSESVYDAFEKTITTVREEKKFTVTYQEPYDENWMNLRRFRQILVVGTVEDPIVQEVMDEVDEPIDEVGIHQVYDIWSNGQMVNVILMPQGWEPADLQPYLEELSTTLDEQYRGYARNRMYMSGRDTALADSLRIEHGFAVELPTVYRWREVDGVFVFRNDNPDPSELIREIVVTWESPAFADLSTEEMLEWRARLVEAHYNYDQDVFLDGMQQRSFEYQGNDAIEVQAQWRNPPESGWPAGGPFITRAITCDAQDRTYLVDAWLYAPGKEKYEYMIQLETILNSFECES